MTNISQGPHVAYPIERVGSCEVSRGSSVVTQCQAAGNSFAGLLFTSSQFRMVQAGCGPTMHVPRTWSACESPLRRVEQLILLASRDLMIL